MTVCLCDCVCVCVFMYVYMYVYVCVCVTVYECVRVNVCVHTCIYLFIVSLKRNVINYNKNVIKLVKHESNESKLEVASRCPFSRILHK